MLRDRLLARLAESGPTPDYPRLAADILGIRNASPDLARRLVAQALVVENRRDHWALVGNRACRDAPAAPGIYIFRDATGQPLYVGKAVSLRRRLRAHFAARQWRALHPAMARVTAVEWFEVGSEIEALLREATLIRELRPPVNIQTRTRALRTRPLPRVLVQDVVIVLPSIDRESVELVAARVEDEAAMLQRTSRSGEDLVQHAARVWKFFHPDAMAPGTHPSSSLAPLIFSWLAGRGAGATRLNPHASGSEGDLQQHLAVLLRDKDLFTDRLIAADHE